MHAAALLMAAAVTLTGPQHALHRTVPATAAGASSATLQQCLVSLKQRAELAAQEPGVITEFIAEEGDYAERGRLLAKIDDQQPQMQKRVAEIALKTAHEQATNTVNIEFAEAARNVAQSELEQAQIANRRVPGAVSQSEVRRRQFALQRAELQIEQAKQEMKVAGFEEETKQAELEASGMNIERRQVTAPFEGIVVQKYKHVGEWVQPGDPILRLVQIDKLYVEGFLSADQYVPGDVDGKPVTVTAALPEGRVAQLDGSIVFVSPEVDPVGGVFRVKAVVNNKFENGYWVLRPGLRADMTIHTDRPAVQRQTARRPVISPDNEEAQTPSLVDRFSHVPNKSERPGDANQPRPLNFLPADQPE